MPISCTLKALGLSSGGEERDCAVNQWDLQAYKSMHIFLEESGGESEKESTHKKKQQQPDKWSMLRCTS